MTLALPLTRWPFIITQGFNWEVASIFWAFPIYASTWITPLFSNTVPLSASSGRSTMVGSVHLIKLFQIFILGCGPFVSYYSARMFFQQFPIIWRSPFCLAGRCILAKQQAHRKHWIGGYDGSLVRTSPFGYLRMICLIIWCVTETFTLCQGQRNSGNGLQFWHSPWWPGIWVTDKLGPFCEGNLTNSHTGMD